MQIVLDLAVNCNLVFTYLYLKRCIHFLAPVNVLLK